MTGTEVGRGFSHENTPRNSNRGKYLIDRWICRKCATASTPVGVRHAHRWGLGKGCLGLRHAHTSGKGVPYLQARHAHASSVAVVFRASKPRKVAFFVCGNISFEKVCCQDKYIKKSPARSCVPCGGFLYVVLFRGIQYVRGKVTWQFPSATSAGARGRGRRVRLRGSRV